MTDVHSHLIFNVDDGCVDLSESLRILKKMKIIGFDNVIITPHYIKGTEYSADNKLKLSRFNEIKDALKKYNIDISIYLGNEIFINNDIVSLINEGEIYPINGKYLLIELPFHNKIINLDDILYELTCSGYVPIIAHPERYSYFHDNYSLVDKLKEEGYLFQCNYGSIIGYYGKSSEKLIKYMLKKGYVDYFGTDVHRLDRMNILDKFDKIEKSIIKVIGAKNYNIIKENCDELINNK